MGAWQPAARGEGVACLGETDPRHAVSILERDAVAHLLDVLLRVERVAVDVGDPELLGEAGADG